MMSNVVIQEREAEPRWMLFWSAEGYELHETATAALDAVKQRDRVLVDGGVRLAVTVIEWRTCTSVGRTVAAVLAKHNREFVNRINVVRP